MRSRKRNRFELADCSTYTSFRPIAMLAICLLRMPEARLPSARRFSRMSSICSNTLIGKPEDRNFHQLGVLCRLHFSALTQTR